MSEDIFKNEIDHLANMVGATDHFVNRLSAQSGQPVDVIMDHVNNKLD